MRNTPSRDDKAARAYAEFDRTDPFAYGRIKQQLERGNCSLGSAEEIIKSMKDRR